VIVTLNAVPTVGVGVCGVTWNEERTWGLTLKAVLVAGVNEPSLAVNV
jgi:hypothetical protein